MAAAPPARAEEPPRVYVIVVDGLGADMVSSELTPAIWSLVHGEVDRATFYPHARATMPSVTNANHVSIMTGSYPAAHGIVGNYFWDRGPSRQRSHLTNPALVEVETLFTAIARERPTVVTAGIFGKRRLAELFGSGGRQQAPTIVWGDAKGDREFPDPDSPLGSDERTAAEIEQTIAERDPRLLFVNLGDVDRTSHEFGPRSAVAQKAVREADRLLGRLVAFLKNRGLWGDLVLFVTADHGFMSLEPSEVRPYPLFGFGRELRVAGMSDVFAVSNGGIESVYLAGVDPGASSWSPRQSERLKSIRALALRQPEIAEALYRLPNVADGGAKHSIGTVHPAWRVAHPRAGELLLVTKPGFSFSDPFAPFAGGLRGNHGGPAETAIPIVVTGGYAKLRRQIAETEPQAENPDIGATAAWLLGFDPPRRTNGDALPATLRGRVLREAFAP